MSMNKIMNWVLAVTFICGASVITSCSANDTNDNPSQEQAKKDRKEFIQHTRQNLKEVAENLNFSSWRIANRINQIFNTTVLNNPEFEKAIIPLSSPCLPRRSVRLSSLSKRVANWQRWATSCMPQST